MAAELNPAARPSRGYAPGFRFMPTDLEIIDDYLKKKVNNQQLPLDGMYDVNLYQENPQTLTESFPKLGDNDWYFFTRRERKHKNGSRPNRAAGDGYWRATGKDIPIRLRNGSCIGWKRVLDFHRAKPPKRNKTDWSMYEFRVDQPRGGGDGMRLDDWVLCRIYKKVNRTGQNNQQAAEASPLEDSTPVDQNNSPEFMEAHDPEVGNNNNNNNSLGPIVIHDDNANQVAANNCYINGVPLVQDLANCSTAPLSQNALPPNVAEASSYHINFGFDGATNASELPQNVPDSSFFGEGWGTQKGDFQVHEYLLETQYSTNPSQMGHSLFGPSTSNLSESKIGIEDYDKDWVTNSFAQPQNVLEPSFFDIAGCGFQEGDFWEQPCPTYVPPQSGLSYFGPSNGNLSESEI